ncbi:MAG: hypothetical protein K2G88_09325 [Oscillospiraceae bacterium]|nr:hypothetical protein [Oscillospiraceae bacterium]
MKLTKITAGLAAVSMLFAVTSQLAFAENTVTLTAEKVTAAQGSDFTLKLDLSGVPENGVSCAEFAVTYDPSVITITGAEAGSIVNTTSDGFDDVAVFDADYSEAGMITVTYGTVGDASTWVKADGTFMTITGKASGTAGSSTDIAIKAINRAAYDEPNAPVIDEFFVGSVDSDDNVANYTVNTVAGSVTIEGGSEEQNPTNAEGQSAMKGDLDLNFEVTIADVVYATRVALGKESLNGQGYINGDVDEDGNITPADALNIMQYVVGLISKL